LPEPASSQRELQGILNDLPDAPMNFFNKIRFSLRDLLAGQFSSPLARNTLWALAGYGMRLLVQAGYFILMARYLGVKQYGGFIAVTALVSLISPFVGLGSGNLLVKNASRDKSLFAAYWGQGLWITTLSGAGLVVFVVGLCLVLLPRGIPVIAIVLIAVSDLIFVKLLEMAGWAFQAFEMISKCAHLNVLLSVFRLLGIAGLALTMEHPNFLAWSAVYFAGSVLAALIGVIWVTRRFGKPRLPLNLLRGERSEGFYFSVSLSAQTIYNDIDKTMVARLASLEAAGIYGAAYRLIDVAFTPVRALLNAAYPGFFRNGHHGIQESLRYGRRLLKRAIPYSILASAALVIGAPLVPFVLGRDYAGVGEALRWLAVLPVLKTIHYFTADSLTGAGYQGLRTLTQVGVAVFNVAINFWLIPAYGWRGAAWSSIASDGLLALTLWIIAARLSSAFRSKFGQTAFMASDAA